MFKLNKRTRNISEGTHCYYPIGVVVHQFTGKDKYAVKRVIIYNPKKIPSNITAAWLLKSAGPWIVLTGHIGNQLSVSCQ